VVEEFSFINDGRGGSGGTKTPRSDDVKIEDVEGEVDLSDIPF
jgi:hypothetical protein